MDARTKAGLILVYGAWVPMVVWQSSPEWAAKVIGESTYKAIAATPAVDVIIWVWFIGALLAGFYLTFGLDFVSFFRRFRRKR